ncbi:MAG: PilZ domain-containing protein [Planctomycetota bacterium]
MSDKPPSVRDLLKLSPTQFASIVADLDTKSTGYAGKQRRGEERLRSVSIERALLATNPHHVDNRELHRVRPIDLSAGGACVLHGAFIYPKEPVALLIADVDGSPARLDATVRRCRLLTGRTHEIGLQFSEPIDTSRFLSDATSVEEVRKSASTPQSGEWTDLLKMTSDEMDKIMRTLQAGTKDVDPDVRHESRQRFDEGAVLAVLNATSDSDRQIIRVRPLDISPSGSAFLHGAFLHPGTPCDLIVQNLRAESVQISGRVVNCRFVSGRVHVVGVEFAQSVNLSDFVADEAGEEAA